MTAASLLAAAAALDLDALVARRDAALRRQALTVLGPALALSPADPHSCARSEASSAARESPDDWPASSRGFGPTSGGATRRSAGHIPLVQQRVVRSHRT